MFSPSAGLYQTLAAYAEAGKAMQQADEAAVVRGLNVLVKVSRKISQFLNDHRAAFKNFTFNQKEHSGTILRHAEALSKFLRDNKSGREEMFRFPALDELGCLVFYQSPPGEPEKSEAKEEEALASH